ncbi:hypothetical protein L210DRAFT_2927534 [Boletus edulis BED1]|uniref:Fungal-type protein kinase domain-containing protein n=1 Tax=Boletus edulis BED1 TaxID=1328754 RepID=A0AAD4C0Z8_BOLED|nr:hypothetical protein L210DRAFT_2927534 [Boletus edulis BED1]
MQQQKSMSTADPTDDQDSWDGIAVSFEFKKGSSKNDRIDNQQKLIWDFHSIMREDARFTFDVTIENTDVRLWFTCRAATVVSEPFNFFTDVDDLIYLFCSLVFAKDVKLGWDPTIQRVLVGSEIQYDITFNGQEGPPAVFRTVKIIADFGADALRGRGTRVFKAYDLKNYPPTEDDFVVIEDAWRDHDRLREDQILKNIFEDIAKLDPDNPEAVITTRSGTF